MALTALPAFIRTSYKVAEWKSATAVLATDFPAEWAAVIKVLSQFRLLRSEIVARGGGLSKISQRINKAFEKEGWKERKFNTKIVIDETELAAPTHKVDCFKNGIALELEWNNKTEFYDRDLNNFRLLFDLRVVSVGIIITRSTELDGVLRRLGRYTPMVPPPRTWISCSRAWRVAPVAVVRS